MPNHFSLISLHLFQSTDSCILKRLKSGTYLFERITTDETRTMDDFWGKNISIHAIVGKNGSGKSTLFDIILILINNFSYYVLKNSWNNDNTLPLKYVQGMCGYLTFRIDDTEGKIDCHGDRLKFDFGEKKYAWGFIESDMASKNM